MFAIIAVTVMSLGLTPAFAWSINNEVDFDNWSISSGTDFKSYTDTRCDNEVTVSTNTSTNTIVFNWNGHSTCTEAHSPPTHSFHDFNKVRGDITIDGTTYDIEEIGVFDYFGQETYYQNISAGDEISVDLHWYYRQ